MSRTAILGELSDYVRVLLPLQRQQGTPAETFDASALLSASFCLRSHVGQYARGCGLT